MTQMPAVDSQAALLERVVVGGDLSRLSAADRLLYYRQVCESVGLNPLTRPFDYLTLSGRLVLYAKRDATDQLRKIHGVSITKMESEKYEELYVVTAYASDKEGRTDTSKGAVSIGGLKGDALANAVMKAETKAKRRVTLSLCGLGLLDETEVETVRDARVAPIDHETGEITAPETPDQHAARLFPDEPVEDRNTLIGRIQGAAAKKKLTADERRALWEKHCGSATPETADLAALADLLAAVQAK